MTLRVDDDALRAAASRWRALATGLTSGATPDVSGLSSQASAMVVPGGLAGIGYLLSKIWE